MTDTNVATTNQNKPPIVVMRERLMERKGELKAALTDIDPDHFIRALVTAAQINPDLQACSFQSLWNAVMKACRDNLLPDGREGAIVPFKSTATWIPMYQGLLKRFRQSGQCKWIAADLVRNGETFEYWIDQDGTHFKHVPQGDDNAPIQKVYAAALTKDGAFYVAVMSMTEINKIKAMSKGSRDDAPWKVWPGEMMKKTALRRLSKLLPAGRDVFDEMEDEDFREADPPVRLAAVERAPGAASALDHFAGTAPEGGEGGPTEERSSTPIETGPVDPLLAAYRLGQKSKTDGVQRRALPGNYREEDRREEAEAWLAGWDGKEEWTDSKSGEVHSARGPTDNEETSTS